ncbi:Response regulator receiver protein [Hyella patelloides LEGE 07179]|uniref:Response regulator receiver protein n=1 Tax=Hyella patelloides LEGE 07179 TaxID=945734 RepID=A0A563VQY4_9CYAN|nr:response regulator [Hyella patelloides]VEP13878.1 Response regulator receiver protein [Hyella patelloides LEGE 07179]
MKTLKSEEAIAESLQLIDKVFRGSLVIKAGDFLKWKLYFRLGRLSWVTGGVNPNERLQRHLAIFCPKITPTQLQQIPLEHQPYREQKVLVDLQGQGLIQRSQMASLMESIAIEVLFDAIQYGETNNDNLSCNKVSEEQNDNLLLLLPFLNVDAILTEAKQQWDEWETAGFSKYSPNLYPTIKQVTLLKSVIKSDVEQKIVRSMDGNQTLRKIAAKNKIGVLDVTRFVLSLFDLEAVTFSKVPRTKNKTSTVIDSNPSKPIASAKAPSKKTPPKYHKTKANKSPLVVCVDDSPLICKVVKDIVLEQNYDFLEIQEPIKVIPTLLRKKPNLIFLDLMMPVINGYELCAQLRKTPRLKDVPIIILTGKDGLIDRMRAKMVGSTDFMAKPVDKLSLLKMLEKYLTVNQ